jgi:PAXNEB protein
MASAFVPNRARKNRNTEVLGGDDGRVMSKTDNTSDTTPVHNVSTTTTTSTSTTTTSTNTTINFSMLQGVRPGTAMTYKTSTGLGELDNILDGGQLIGTCLMIQEDHFNGDIARSVVKYWCAEAISQNHHLIVPICSAATTNPKSSDPEKLDEIINFDEFDNDGDESYFSHSTQSDRANFELILSSLPRNRHWDKSGEGNGDSAGGGTGTSRAFKKNINVIDESEGLNVLIEEVEEDDEEEEEEGNTVIDVDTPSQSIFTTFKPKTSLGTTIRNDTKKKRQSNIFCHSYDLSRKLSEQMTIEPSEYVLDVLDLLDSTTSKNFHIRGFHLFQQLVTAIINKIKHNKAAVVRLLFLQRTSDVLAVALPLLLAYCRNNSIPIVVMICTPRPSTTTKNMNTHVDVCRSCDYVLTAESFISAKEYPPAGEYQHLRGLLKVVKTAVTSSSTTANTAHSLLYGCKRDARKLHLSLLHIQPE